MLSGNDKEKMLRSCPGLENTQPSFPTISTSHTLLYDDGEGNGNLLQYSCLENPTDRGARWAIVHGVAGST